jgi:non-ribosomal peptide synthetase component E (peptide arylation enzyme)
MHAEYLGSCAAWNRRQRLGPYDVSLWALPMIHNAGMILMLIPSLLDRRTVVLRPQFEIDDFLGAITKHKVTYAGSIGPIAPRIIDHPALERFDLSSLRSFFALSRADGVEERTKIPSHLMYGITEGMLMSCFPEDSREARHNTLGWPTGIGEEARLLEPTSNSEVPLGKTGEFCFRGPHTLRAYFNAPDITAESFTSDGFFRTGDLMRSTLINGRIHYIFEGRLKDNINRGGEKFGAEEVEALIVQYPDVNDARVVSMPDPLLGERACCFLIPKSGRPTPTLASLGAFLQSRGLAKFKLPERIEVITEFPVTRVGKADKIALRKMIADKLRVEATEKSKKSG